MKSFNPIDKGLQLAEFTAKYMDVINIIWKENRYINQPDRFYYTLAMKTVFILDSITFQIANLDQKPHYAITAVLALRTSMLDVLNIYYVMDQTDNKNEVENRIDNIMADHLNRTFKELNDEQKLAVRKDWPRLFLEDGSLKNFNLLTTKKMKDNINHVNLKPESEEAFHIYSMFSKFEHNGMFTFDILHNPYYPDGAIPIRYLIISAIEISVIALKYISGNYIEPEEPLAKELNSIASKIFN